MFGISGEGPLPFSVTGGYGPMSANDRKPGLRSHPHGRPSKTYQAICVTVSNDLHAEVLLWLASCHSSIDN